MLIRRFDKGRKRMIKFSEYGSIFLSKKDRQKMQKPASNDQD